MSAWTTARLRNRLFHLVFESHNGRGADSEEKHESASDIDTAMVDSLKALGPGWPIREADLSARFCCDARSRISGRLSSSAVYRATGRIARHTLPQPLSDRVGRVREIYLRVKTS
jgi:hypothetical protein